MSHPLHSGISTVLRRWVCVVVYKVLDEPSYRIVGFMYSYDVHPGRTLVQSITTAPSLHFTKFFAGFHHCANFSISGLTCFPQRAALLKSMLNFLKKAIPDPAFSESIRHCESLEIHEYSNPVNRIASLSGKITLLNEVYLYTEGFVI